MKSFKEKMTFIAQISSLYPIDVTACLYHSVLNPDASFRIFVTDAFDYVDSPSRRFVARGALPLSSWEYSPGSAWQQHHVALPDDPQSPIEPTLALVGESYVIAAPSISENIEARLTDLRGIYEREPPTGQFKYHWATVSARLVGAILKQCGVGRLTVESFADLRAGQSHAAESNAAMVELLGRLEHGRPTRLSNGGKIESLLDGLWRSFGEVTVQGQKLLLNSENAGNGFEVKLEDIVHHSWRFRGPLELLLISQFGTLVDLPWYSSGHEFLPSLGREDGVEVISPIHFSDPRRGTSANRLLPTGYSLVEYDHPVVAQYVSSVLGCAIDVRKDLRDVQRFLASPPASAQRFTKSQSASRSYRNAREEQWRRSLLSLSEARSALRTIDHQIHRLRLGEHLTLMGTLATLLKEHLLGHIDLKQNSPLWTPLLEIGLIGDDGKPDGATFLKLLDRDIYYLEGCLGRKDVTLSYNGCKSVTDSERMLSSYKSIYREMSDLYYEWLSFMLSGPLKSHILSLYLLIGPRDIRDVIGDLINRRAVTSLPFRLAPWTFV